MIPTITATRTTPQGRQGFLRVVITYDSDQVTEYPRVPMWWYGLMWARARRLGGGVGLVVASLQRAYKLLKPVTLRRGRSQVGRAHRRRVANLAAYPGDMSGMVAQLEAKS